MILINGVAQSSIEAVDRGLHYGDGLFETIAVTKGKPQLWQTHMDRLLEGCRRLEIPPPDLGQLRQEVDQLCCGEDKAVLKLIITRGSGGRGYRPPVPAHPNRLLFRYPWPEHADEKAGIVVRLCATPVSCNPALAGIKHLNRLEQVLARQEWDDDSVGEGLMSDGRGNVIEGTMSNLFAVRDGVLLTPDLGECGIAGVMRAQVLKLAEALSQPYQIIKLPAAELAQMDELFITNSIIGIRPVSCCDVTEYDNENNSCTRRLQSALYLSLGSEHA